MENGRRLLRIELVGYKLIYFESQTNVNDFYDSVDLDYIESNDCTFEFSHYGDDGRMYFEYNNTIYGIGDVERFYYLRIMKVVNNFEGFPLLSL